MKKGLIIFLMILGCLLLSGCTIGGTAKTDVLSCSKSGSSKGINYVETHDLSFQGKKITEYKLKLKFDFSSIYSDTKLFEDTVDKLRVEYSKAIEKGVRTDVYPEESNAVAVFTINPEEFDGVLNYMDYDLKNVFSSKFTLSDLKLEMEKNYYTCETK